MERKVCFISDASNWAGEGGRPSRGRHPSTPNHHHRQSLGKSFCRWREGLHAETAQSALTVILKLVIGGLTSIILVVLGVVNLQSQGRSVSIFLRHILRIGAACVMATVWSSCTWLLHLVGVSISTRQLTGYGSENYLETLRRNQRSSTMLDEYIIIIWSPLTVSPYFCIFTLLWLNLFFF